MKHQRRYSDEDVLIGNRITYYPTERSGWEVMLGSGDDEYPGCKLVLRVPGHGLVVWLPAWLKPHVERVQARYWDAATIERMGRDWYEQVHEREYGFYVSGGHFVVKHGQQTDDSSTTKLWSKFLPWTQWRFHKHVYYGLEGQVDAEFVELPTNKKFTPEERRDAWAEKWEFEKQLVERIRFTVLDGSDGTRVSGTAFMESRHYKFGEGRWWRWLSLFRKDRVHKSLSIKFDKEVGNEKGSWKGGMTGTSIEVLPGELHEAAFARFCAEAQTDKGGRYKLTPV